MLRTLLGSTLLALAFATPAATAAVAKPVPSPLPTPITSPHLHGGPGAPIFADPCRKSGHICRPVPVRAIR